MTTNSRITPFANGSEYLSWLEGNCYKCEKYAPDAMSLEDGACEIELALGEGSIGDGTIEITIFDRMGKSSGKCGDFTPFLECPTGLYSTLNEQQLS